MDKQTIETYNKTAEEYDRETAGFWEQFPRTFLDEFISRSGQKILDSGSGPGRDGLLLKDAGKTVVCLDASAAMIAASAQRGLVSVLGDFLALPFSDNEFDGVWSYTSLLHATKSDAVKALTEISRVLKPGGILALGLIEGEGELRKEGVKPGESRWFSYYQKAEVINLCGEAELMLEYFESFRPGARNYLNFIFKKKPV